RRLGTLLGIFPEQKTRGFLAIDPGIDVAGARDFEPVKAGNGADRANNLFGDLAWRLTQLLGQLKAEGQSVFAHGDAWRLVHHQARQIEAILPLQEVADMTSKLLLELPIQCLLPISDDNQWLETLPVSCWQRGRL